MEKFLAVAMTSSKVTTLGGLVEAGELDLLEESLAKLRREHSKSLSEARLSEQSGESKSLGWSSAASCLSLCRGMVWCQVWAEVGPVRAKEQEIGDQQSGPGM